jgi:hypothetical protein
MKPNLKPINNKYANMTRHFFLLQHFGSNNMAIL